MNLQSSTTALKHLATTCKTALSSFDSGARGFIQCGEEFTMLP